MRIIKKDVIIYGNTHKLEFNIWNNVDTGRTQFFLYIHDVCMILDMDAENTWCRLSRRLKFADPGGLFNYKEYHSSDTSIKEYKRLIYHYILHEYKYANNNK